MSHLLSNLSHYTYIRETDELVSDASTLFGQDPVPKQISVYSPTTGVSVMFNRIGVAFDNEGDVMYYKYVGYTPEDRMLKMSVFND